MIVRPAPPEHYRWIAERANLVITHAFYAIEAVDGDRILGMIGFDGWTPNSCSVHIALGSPLALRRLVPEALRLVFKEWKRGVLLAAVLSTNTKSLNISRHLGFREKTRIHDGWDKGVDLLIFEMRGDTWELAEAARAARPRYLELGLVPRRHSRSIRP